jgi:cytochrome c peroxidase
MPRVRLGAVSKQIDRLYREGTLAGLGDAALLERFLTHRDEVAFETLVNVHGPMVLGLCRRMLREPEDVEDAFQATFLVLVRKAPAIRDRELLANWLYGVAYRVASRALSDIMRRRGREIAVANLEASVNAEATDIAEIAPVLDRELNRLPRNYRTALVCCYLGGQTHEQTAKALGCPVGTVRSRIARGRDMLRKRLTRLGYAPSVAFLGPAGGLPTKLLTEAVPPDLVSVTVNAGLAIGTCKTIQAGAVGATVLALTQRALTTMKLAQLKWIGLAVLATTCSAGGLIAVSYASGQAGQGQTAAPGSGEGGLAAPGGETGNPSTVRTLHLPEQAYRYADLDLPQHFKTEFVRRFDNTPNDNPVTDHGATLGRILFYDTRLSANNTISCGSCHVQRNAFADPNRFSKGFDAKLTDRHAMSLVNLRYAPRGRFFWDERAEKLEETVLVPIESKLEMGQDLTKLVEVLAKDERYPELFQKAFGDRKLSRERLGKALAQFLRSMVSCQSKYDEGLAKATSVRDDFPNFTVQENRGKALFMSNCASCHQPAQDVNFLMSFPGNNGLDADPKIADGGVGDITFNGRDIGRFKSPSLRNVEHTGPYMHDGRFSTLDRVIDHYSKEVKPHPNLDPRMHPLNFTDSEKAALIAFLKTLTDRTFLADPKFSDPWR